MNRPGSRLLVTPNPEELKGAPGPARDAALAAAATDQGDQASHLLDAAFASIAAGEAREALRLLKRIESLDETVRRRARVGRAWAEHADANLYPGWMGGELTEDWRDITTVGAPQQGDPETVLLEAYCSLGPVPLLSARLNLESTVRLAPIAAQALFSAALADLQQLTDLAASLGAGGAVLWAMTQQAGMAHRCGEFELASQTLFAARQAAVQLGDPVALAATLLEEGDWFATPGSSPEASGLDLTTQNLPSPLAATADLARAESAYDQASEALDGVDAPRAHGALALRRGVLAGLTGRTEDRLHRLEEARSAFASAGDVASLHLVSVHTLLGRIADGAGPSVRAEAGSGWDLLPRGPMADIVEWARTRGSVSWCTGLGRLCQRAAESWASEGDLENAEIAYLLAVPLIPISGAVPQDGVIAGLATLDNRRNFGARALVRIGQALRSVPPDDPRLRDEMGWLRRAELLMSLSLIQTTRGGSSRVGRGLAGLDRAAGMIESHISLVTPVAQETDEVAGVIERGRATMEGLLSAPAGAGVEDLFDASGPFVAGSHTMVTTVAGTLAVEAARARCTAAITRARLALAAGWETQADQFFAEALRSIESAGPELAWMAVLVDVSSGDRASAHRRLEAVRHDQALPDDLLASLAVRAGAYETARSHLEHLEAQDWPDVVDRAEVALGTGDTQTAARLTGEAVDLFEQGAATLERDSDLVTYCDNITTEFMYLLGVRAWLEIEESGTSSEHQALEQAFYLSDRARSLSLRHILPNGSAVIDRSRQHLATEWSAQFDRLVATIEAEGAEPEPPDLTSLDELERRLVLAEGQSDRSPSTSHPGDHLRLQQVQENLPEDACLVQYHLAGRELVVFGITSDEVEHHRVTLERPRIPGLVRRFVERCGSSDPGEEAGELSGFLLDPIADVLADHRRVIVVPYGPLAAVPFHVLPFQSAALIDDHDLSYLQTASLLGRHPVDAALGGSGALVVGDPRFDQAAHPYLRRLRGALTEAQVVGRLLGSEEVLTDADATEGAVKQLLGGRSIVHLAAHGMLNEIAPAASSIVLSGRDELTVADLIGLRTDAQLVVLSACDTGRGATTLGGDVVGLTRGLLAAGARRSIASLWPVYDTAACVTMDLFYRALTGKPALPPAAALAHAQRELKSMTRARIDARYLELGGAVNTGRRRRRAEPSSGAPTVRKIPLAPEFVDTDDELDETRADRPASVVEWAPFVLLGQ